MKTSVTPSDDPTHCLIEQVLGIARVSALEEMASGFAHELNQPLGAVTTFAQAARRMLDRPDPMIRETLEVLGHISEEALKAGEGIRRIRKLFHHRDAVRTSCSIAELVQQLQPLIEPIAARSSVQLAIARMPALPQVIVDRLRIQHVLLALFQNALEASRPGDPHPYIGIDIKADPYLVEVAMTDHGVGIAPESVQHIFMPFFTTKPHGTGLGLASSRAIIEAHGGTIGFDAVEGGGTRFWFRIPTSSSHS